MILILSWTEKSPIEEIRFRHLSQFTSVGYIFAHCPWCGLGDGFDGFLYFLPIKLNEGDYVFVKTQTKNKYVTKMKCLNATSFHHLVDLFFFHPRFVDDVIDTSLS